MKKLIAVSISVFATSAVMASPINPMDYYQADNVDQKTADYIWENMTQDVRGKDCYKRAQIWTMGMRDLRRRQVKAKKIFIHYTEKFNMALDQISDERDIWGSYKTENKYGERVLNQAEQNLYKDNITWDYHVAPMIEVDGEDVVLDRYLELPYDMPHPYVDTKDYKLEQKVRRATPDEWLEALTYRGEMLWKIKKKVIEAKIPELYAELREKDSRSSREKIIEEINVLRNEYKRLEMDKKDSIDIKCTEITSMAELDANHENAWCFYSVVPMYYFNEIDLRNLAYGYSGYKHFMPVPVSANTPEANKSGEQFIQHAFNIEELKLSLGEIDDRDTKAYYKSLYKYLKEKEEAKEKREKELRKRERRRNR